MVFTVLFDAWTGMMWRACWQGSLVVLVVWSICRLLPSMPAQFQCWLWRLAVVKFMVVLLLPSLLNVPLLPAPSVATPYATSKRERDYSQPFGVAIEDPAAKLGAENHVVPKTDAAR